MVEGGEMRRRRERPQLIAQHQRYRLRVLSPVVRDGEVGREFEIIAAARSRR
jgi:hypothetical protein